MPNKQLLMLFSLPVIILFFVLIYFVCKKITEPKKEVVKPNKIIQATGCGHTTWWRAPLTINQETVQEYELPLSKDGKTELCHRCLEKESKLELIKGLE